MKSSIFTAIALLTFPIAAGAQDDAPPFPKPGSVMPQSFAPLNLNRLDLDKLYASAEDKDKKPDIKARRRCLMCEVGVRPFILVFVRKPAAKDGLLALTNAMEAAIGRNADSYLNGAVVIVDPAASSSLQNPDEKEPEKLIKEEAERRALYKWLNETFTAWLDEKINKDKKVYIAIYPEPGPAKFTLDPKAEVTVFFSHKHHVIEHWQFAPGMFTDQTAKEIIAAVEKKLAEASN